MKQLVARVLELCATAGAGAAEVDVGNGQGLTVTVRMGDTEKVEHERDKGMSVTVYFGRRKGSASSTDFSDAALRETVAAACTIAQHGSEDEYAGLIDPRYMATEVPNLDLYHPWELAPEQALEIALACESAARAADPRIRNSEGASVSTYSGYHAYGNSHGFCGGWAWSSHSIDCALIAEADGQMQRDGWYGKARAAGDLGDVAAIGRTAATRALARLGARSLSTRRVPVLFEAPVAASLFGAFIGAISGGALYRKASFLLNKLGEPVFSNQVQVRERPHARNTLGSAPFDNDGMATRNRDLVRDGVLQGYVLSAYSARKLGMEPTGNAGGVHNLVVEPGSLDLPGLLRSMDTGLLVTDLIGFGVNQVTGDYSRGAAGFWIERGEIQYPVEEITIAGNLADMYRRIVAIGNDIDARGNIKCGSVLVEDMTVAGT